jgi:hypothetical protein
MRYKNNYNPGSKEEKKYLEYLMKKYSSKKLSKK